MKLDKKIFAVVALSVYGVLLFLLMTFYRLPADKVIAGTVENLTRGRMLLNAEKVRAVPPTTYSLEKVSYSILFGNTRASDQFKSLTLRPDYQRLLLGYLPVKFKAVMPRGVIHGRTGISIGRGIEDSYLRVKIPHLSLEDLKILRFFLARDVMGTVRGELSLEGNLSDPSKINGEGRLYAEKGSVDTRIDLPGMEALSFENIKLSFSINEGRVVFKDSEMNGQMFSGHFSGEIRLKKEITKSSIRVEAKMKPGQLLKRHKLASQFLATFRKGNRPLTVKIGGTLERPSIVWDKS